MGVGGVGRGKEILVLFAPSCPFQSLSCKIRLTATLRNEQQSTAQVMSPRRALEERMPGNQAAE